MMSCFPDWLLDVMMTNDDTLSAVTQLIGCSDVISRDAEEVKVCGVRALAALCQRNPSYIAWQIDMGRSVDVLFAALVDIVLGEGTKVSYSIGRIHARVCG